MFTAYTEENLIIHVYTDTHTCKIKGKVLIVIFFIFNTSCNGIGGIRRYFCVHIQAFCKQHIGHFQEPDVIEGSKNWPMAGNACYNSEFLFSLKLHLTSFGALWPGYNIFSR